VRRRRQPEVRPVDMRLFEKRAYRQGYQVLAGVDEAGRGPLAGPVVAAAVVLPKRVRLPGVKDSKLLTPEEREYFYERIRSSALAAGVGWVDPSEIDRINILQATFKAMLMAISRLKVRPDYLLIDGPYKLPLEIGQEGIAGGDNLSASIAAASVIAKVHRDRLMRQYHSKYPQYGFDRHKGYGTAAHRAALREFGPCPLHRMTFRGVPPGEEIEDGDADPDC
jgi:ribonuclease HII